MGFNFAYIAFDNNNYECTVDQEIVCISCN